MVYQIQQEEEGKSLEILHHSTSHILAQAVKRLFPQAKLGIGPSIKDGFYYDFDLNGEIISQNISQIEEEMRNIVARDIPLKREVMEKEKARKIFEERDEPYKLELLGEIQEEKVSLYWQAEFVDLCRGPHLESTGKVGFFKLLSVAGAYWRGKEDNSMLTRIYGTCFWKKEDLDRFLKRIEQAKQRDHRRLGKELGIFSIIPDAGPGLVFYHPQGAILRDILEKFEKREHLKRGYQLVHTPHISRAHLWEKSGHLDFYRKNMYVFSIAGEDYVLKPMNCPGHILIYKTKIRSYRELPVRYFELGTVYRHEESGVLHGLLRLRGFTQDDAHIFCLPSQLIGEVRGVLQFIREMMCIFNLGFQVTLSTRPKKYIGSLESWEKSTQALREALEEESISYRVAPGEGAFYGPKIDIQMEDALGRLWQGPTVQVDFNLPERFDITYVDVDGKKKRVVMIHRVVLGTIERFLGVLLEHSGGNLPLWLAPVQVRVLSITEKQREYARQVFDKLKIEGIRTELDDRDEMLGYKIREFQLKRIPYLLIVGPREVEKQMVTVRKRSGENLKNVNLGDFLALIRKKVKKEIEKPCC